MKKFYEKYRFFVLAAAALVLVYSLISWRAKTADSRLEEFSKKAEARIDQIIEERGRLAAENVALTIRNGKLEIENATLRQALKQNRAESQALRSATQEAVEKVNLLPLSEVAQRTAAILEIKEPDIMVLDLPCQGEQKPPCISLVLSDSAAHQNLEKLLWWQGDEQQLHLADEAIALLGKENKNLTEQVQNLSKTLENKETEITSLKEAHALQLKEADLKLKAEKATCRRKILKGGVLGTVVGILLKALVL